MGVREPDVPAEAVLADLFGGQAEAALAYADLLATRGVDRGLLGPREIPRLWSRHILNCAVVAPAFGAADSVCDLGSGAGLPGVVLALARPDLHLTLVEPLLRRADFLAEVVSRLGLEVEVVRARAECLAGTVRFDAVTARAVAPLDRLAAWALPLTRQGGELIAIKGERARAELLRATAVLHRLGAGPGRIEAFGAGVVDPVTTVVRIASKSS